jgi:hypothetical protein
MAAPRLYRLVARVPAAVNSMTGGVATVTVAR